MKELLQLGKITELKTSQNVSYVLEDSDLFNLTGYKVLTNQDGEGFVKCAKVLYNGKIKLLYFTSGQKNLKNMMSLIDTDTFIVIIANLIKSIVDIKHNGFLSCLNLDLSFDKIYVDQHKFTISLIYLPLKSVNADELEFENDFRTNLIKIISSTPSLANSKMGKISSLLSNGALSMEELQKAIKAEIGGTSYTPPENGKKEIVIDSASQPTLEFISLDNNNPIRFSITTPEFIIGKNPSKVNGVIGFNKAIGRVHCRFLYQNGQYYIIDGDGTKCSTNGTYVNGTKLTNIRPFAVKSGDRIRLANSDFAIQF